MAGQRWKDEKARKGRKARKGKKDDESVQGVKTTARIVSVRKGGKLKVGFRKYGGPKDVTVAKAELKIGKKSIKFVDEKRAPKSVLIGMTVTSGTLLGDILFSFTPGGEVTFTPNARLTVYLRGPVLAEQVKKAVHVFGEGSQIENIETVTNRRGEAFLVVTVRVPGFSRYSLGDGSFAPEADGPAW